MRLQSSTQCVLGVFLYFAPLTCFADLEQGNILLYNNCRFPLFVEEVVGVTYLDTELEPQRRLTLPFRLTVNGTRTSIKVSTTWRSLRVTQIEYSACFGNENSDCGPFNMIYYDLSKINDPSNTEYGVRIEPKFAGCETINCPAHVYRCEKTYYQPSDNYATKACDVKTDLNVTFCS
jgi:hypothetical protein